MNQQMKVGGDDYDLAENKGNPAEYMKRQVLTARAQVCGCEPARTPT